MFGGIIQNEFGQQMTCNELLEIVSYDVENEVNPNGSLFNKKFMIQDVGVAFIRHVKTEGIQPIPRKDHAVTLLKNYMLVYGGKFDGAL